MSPLPQGLNPPRSTVPQWTESAELRSRYLFTDAPEQNRHLTEPQNEVGHLVSAHLIHRKRDLLYGSVLSAEGLLAVLARHVAWVIRIPGESSCRHVGNRRCVAAGRGVQQRERHRPFRAGHAGEDPGTARIVLKKD